MSLHAQKFQEGVCLLDIIGASPPKRTRDFELCFAQGHGHWAFFVAWSEKMG